MLRYASLVLFSLLIFSASAISQPCVPTEDYPNAGEFVGRVISIENGWVLIKSGKDNFGYVCGAGCTSPKTGILVHVKYKSILSCYREGMYSLWDVTVNPAHAVPTKPTPVSPPKPVVTDPSKLILGTWYPAEPSLPPGAGILAYHFLRGGNLRSIVYITGRRRLGEPVIEDQGKWALDGSNLKTSIQKEVETFSIIALTADTLVIETVGQNPWRSTYKHTANALYIPFGTEGTIPIRAKRQP